MLNNMLPVKISNNHKSSGDCKHLRWPRFLTRIYLCKTSSLYLFCRTRQQEISKRYGLAQLGLMLEGLAPDSSLSFPS